MSQVRAFGAKPIVSYHNYDGVLNTKMESILNEQIANGAAVCKIITTAKRVEDNLPVLSFVSFASIRLLVCFCMVKKEKSRSFSRPFLAYFTLPRLKVIQLLQVK
jgi:3-dehydroquinate dehydratase